MQFEDLYYFLNENTGVIIMSKNPEPPNFGLHVENGTLRCLSWIPLNPVRKNKKSIFELELDKILRGNSYDADC